jgi:hypothetical protein
MTLRRGFLAFFGLPVEIQSQLSNTKGKYVKKKTAGKTAAALVVAGGLALGGLAAPASAATAAIDSGTASWEFYPDEPTYFPSAKPLSDGENSNWTQLDWYDNPADFVVEACNTETSAAMDTFGMGGGYTNLIDSDITEGGISSFDYEWEFWTGCGEIIIDATLTFQGNSVKYDFTVVKGEVDSFGFRAYAPVDGVDWAVQSDSSAVGVPTDDTSSLFGWKVSSDAQVTDFVDEGTFLAGGANPTRFSAVMTMLDYTPGTGLDSILPYFKQWAPTLDQSFGAMHGLYSGTDAPAYDLLTLKQGVAVDQVWEGTYTPFFMDGDAPYFSAGDNDYVLGDLPAGLTATVVFDEETGEPVVTLSGTPTEAGYWSVPLTFTRELSDDGRFYPLMSILEIVVPETETAALPTGNTPEGELAHTGFDAGPLGFAAIVMMLGAALIGVRKARKA